MGIVVADRKFFGEIGSLDGGMKIYGGENVELGIRVRCWGAICAYGTTLHRTMDINDYTKWDTDLWIKLIDILHDIL